MSRTASLIIGSIIILHLSALWVFSSESTNPSAEDIIKNSSEVYRDFKTYQALSQISVNSKMGSAETKITYTILIILEKPNRAFLTCTSPIYGFTLVSDGKKVWYYRTLDNKYTADEASRDYSDTFGKVGFSPEISPFVQVITAEDPYQDIMEGVLTSQISLEGEKYIIHFDQEDNTKADIWVRQRDYLIDRLQVHAQQEGGEYVFTEEHQGIVLNEAIPVETFIFHAPEGSQEVDKSEFTSKKVDWEGKPAINFTLEDTKGNEVKLEDFKGKVVILDFWATWCMPCVMELPHLQKIYEDYQDQGLVVLGINSQNDVEAIKKFLKEKGITFPVLYDTEEEVSEKYKVDCIPRLLIIDREGLVRTDFVGLQSEQGIRRELKKVGIEKGGTK